MTAIVESIAKKLHGLTAMSARGVEWEQANQRHHEWVCDCVRAVLIALRDPSDEMIEAMAYADVQSWQNAIDAALNEAP